MLGWLQPFPHPCLTGTSRRTSHEVRLLLYLAAWSIASWHAASAFSQDIYLQGYKITSLLFKLAQHFPASHEQNCSPPCVWAHLHHSSPQCLFWGLYSFTVLFAPEHGSFVHLAAVVFAFFLSEQQSHFNAAAFCKIDKNSLSCRSWRDDENVDSPLKPPQNINNYQERMIDEETARPRGK